VLCSSFTLQDSTISENTAPQGAGILIYEYSPVIQGCQIVNNTAVNGGGGIGVIYADPMIGSEPGTGNYFCGNSAGAGSDLWSEYEPDTIINAAYNTFDGFYYSDYYVSPLAAFDTSNCISDSVPILQDVYVSPSGDDQNTGLSIDSPFKTIRHALEVIYGDLENPVTVHLAAGLDALSATGESFPLPLVSNICISGSGMDQTILDAELTGRLLLGHFPTNTVISDLQLIRGNSTNGAGIFLYYSEVSCSNVLISENSGTKGGGIYTIKSDLTLQGCTIRNQTGFSYGAGLFIDSSSTAILTDGVLSGNRVTFEGGAIYCSRDSFVNCYGCKISENSSNGIGGGVYCNYGTSEINIYDCVVDGNSADKGGGLAYRWNGHRPSKVHNSVIRGNTASEKGGGIFNHNSGQEIVNCLFIDNQAPAGGAISTTGVGGARPEIINCTFSNNNSSQGSAVYIKSTYPSITNCICWDQTLPEIFVSGSPTAYVSYSDIQGGFDGVGNIDADPLFADGPLGGYYLSRMEAGQTTESPCVDGGGETSDHVCFTDRNGEICLDQTTTQTDMISDEIFTDMGYHYSTDAPSPDPTPTPSDFQGVKLNLNDDIFTALDPFLLQAECRGREEDIQADLYIILDYAGLFWFWPDWNMNPDSGLIMLIPGNQRMY